MEDRIRPLRAVGGAQYVEQSLGSGLLTTDSRDADDAILVSHRIDDVLFLGLYFPVKMQHSCDGNLQWIGAAGDVVLPSGALMRLPDEPEYSSSSFFDVVEMLEEIILHKCSSSH
jgi:hypothetical protein